MDQGHDPGPVPEIFFEISAYLCVLVVSVEAHRGDERSEVVLDPMVDPGEEDLFLDKGIVEQALAVCQFFQVIVKFRRREESIKVLGLEDAANIPGPRDVWSFFRGAQCPVLSSLQPGKKRTWYIQ